MCSHNTHHLWISLWQRMCCASAIVERAESRAGLALAAAKERRRSWRAAASGAQSLQLGRVCGRAGRQLCALAGKSAYLGSLALRNICKLCH